MHPQLSKALSDLQKVGERYGDVRQDVEDLLRQALKYVPRVHTYYDNCRDPGERDEVAAAFKDHYVMLTDMHDSPDDIFDELECYILGNERADFRMSLNARVVLMYFFEECDIFKLPPDGWRPVPEPRSEA